MGIIRTLYEDVKYWIFSALQISEPPQDTIQETLRDSALQTAAGFVLAVMISAVLGLAYWIHEILFIVALVLALQFVAAAVISLVLGILKWLLYVLLRVASIIKK